MVKVLLEKGRWIYSGLNTRENELTELPRISANLQNECGQRRQRYKEEANYVCEREGEESEREKAKEM